MSKSLTRGIQITIGTVVALLVLLGLASGFMADLWWFDSLGYASVFWTTYQTKYTLWFIGFVVFLLAMNLNLSIALKSAPAVVMDPRFEQILQAAGRFIRIAAYAVSVLLSLVMAGVLSGGWMELLSWTHAEGFGRTDPVFGNDIGFYLFELPFLQVVRSWLLSAVIVILIAVSLVYLVRQGLSFAFGRIAMSSRARIHLAVLGGLLFVMIAATIWLGRYDILWSTRSGSFYGAGYTDVTAALPASWIMTGLTLIAGVLLVLGLRSGNGRLLVRTMVVYVAAGIVIGGVFPALMQQFIVNPNEQSKELEYIGNNIAMTRDAFDLTRITEKNYEPTLSLTREDLRRDSATIGNIMLWDYRPLASTLDQLQVIRLYYDFPDVDIDRYRLPDGSYRQVMLAARELDQAKLPQNARTWVNQHLVYTHGYGIGMSPVNVVTPEGLPEFFVKDIPPFSPVGIEITRPEIYFGEKTTTPVIVKGNIDEFDYPLGDQNQMTRYQEDAGVAVGSFFRRLIFAMHFADINILISGYIGPESRILYTRQIQDRLSALAPFLQFDKDPYLVVADGRLQFMADAYTVTDRYPYSKPIGGVNYIRNSVKAVVDAYTGNVAFYLSHPERDPIARVYARIFPSLFTPMDEMPAVLRDHIRYPQDLFDLQAAAYETYHMEDPQVFYNKEDLWNIANEKLQNEPTRMESYYAIMRLPGEARPEFIQMVPYTPNRRDNMIAWLCARSDGENYGRLLVYKFPKKALTYGPMQVSARFDQDPYISQQLTLWNQQGSSVSRGNLLVIPIKNDLLYVQPIYLQATSGRIPELTRVIVSYGNSLAMEPTLEEALETVFRDTGSAPARTPDTPAGRTAAPAPAAQGPVNVRALSRSALDRYDRAVRYQREGNWAKYGEELEKLRKDLEGIIDAVK